MFYIDLGNPEDPLLRYSPPETLDAFYGIQVVAYKLMKHDRATHGETVFLYQYDRTKFDAGQYVIVKYSENTDIADALENRILRKKTHMSKKHFHRILPSVIHLDRSITTITFITKDGKRQICLEENFPLRDLPFMVMPPALLLDIPRIPISALMAPVCFGDRRINTKVVLHDGELFTLKHYEVYPWSLEPGLGEAGYTILNELEELCRLSSSSVTLQPSHIVIDDSDDRVCRFRGFLQPFFRAGSLIDVIATVYGLPGSTRPPPLLWRTSKMSGATSTAVRISWRVKRQWCLEIITTLFELHKQQAYIGCLTPGNFILGTDGKLKLINVSPATALSLPYGAPEELAMKNAADPREKPNHNTKVLLTPECDIFSLGLIFWVLVEELVGFDRRKISDIPVLSWSERDGSAPLWFRNLVENCVHRDPCQRPTTRYILAIIHMHSIVERS